MTYQYITYSHKGKRAQNEDSFFPKNGEFHNNLFCVCDGIGGHGDGDLASSFITQKLPDHLPQHLQSATSIELAIRQTDAQLKAYAKKMGNEKMGSTVALLKFDQDRAWLGWVGDSRIYHMRDQQIMFKSKDHSLYQLMLDGDYLSQDEASDFPMKNVIYQALGPRGTRLKPSIQQIDEVDHGDVFLLASDGVFEAWDDMELAYLCAGQFEECADSLYKGCLQKSKDNFTFTLVKALLQ